MESTSSLKRSLSDAEDVSSPKRAAAEVEVVVEAAPSVVKVSPLPVRSPLPLRSVPVSVASPKPRKMELPSIPSVSLLKEQVRSSAAELLGKQFDVETSGMVSSGSCGDVFILPLKNRGVDANKTYAVKQQLVLDPSSLNDQAFRECRILLQLNHLRLERKCFNFVHLEKWFKSRPPLLFGAAQDDSSSVYMYFVLDFAQRNLFREQRLEPEQFRLVLFQLLYALSVAQREFQFVHHDLHLKNILLQDQPPGTVMVYRDLGSTWYIPGPLVKIADFGLARLRIRESDPEEVIYNVRDTFSEVFSRDKDLLKLLDEIQKKKPKGSHPELSEGIKAIKSLIRKSATLREMLRIPYFASLMQRPEGLVVEQCLFCSSDGDIVAAQRAAAGLEGANERNEFEGFGDSMLFESDKVELLKSSERPATRSNKGEQRGYSVYSRGLRKEDDADGRDLVEEFFRAEEERERAEAQRAAEWQRLQEERRYEERLREEILQGVKVVPADLPSAAGRAKRGLTLDESREQPSTKSFREAARLARLAEEQLKQMRSKKRAVSLVEQQSSSNVDADTSGNRPEDLKLE